jgi:four helix bundle protein
LWQQLVRSGTGSSGNLEEADEASSDADFISRMKIALRETKESRRWLRALRACSLTGYDRVAGLEREAKELAAIFATIIIKVKRRVEEEQRRQKAEKRLKREGRRFEL